MNELCKELANNCDILHRLWNIKKIKQLNLLEIENFDDYIDSHGSFKSYIRMEDVELVLRFFAYRQLEDNPATKVNDILDVYLREANKK